MWSVSTTEYMCGYLHSVENNPAHPTIGERGWQLNSDITFQFKCYICNIIPLELVERLRITPLQE